MCNTDVFTKATGRLSRIALLLGLAFFTSGLLTAQIVQDFSTSTPGANFYVDPISPLTTHILPNTMAPQTQPNAATVGTIPGYQVTYTPSRDRGASGGLSDGELFGVVDYTVANTAENNMGSLTIDFATNPPPSGNNNIYVLEDPDGLTTLRFNPVVVDGATMFSMSYIVANTSFENSDGADDRIAIYLENLGDGQRTVLLEAANDLIFNDETWRELTADLSALAGATVQLVVEFDSNSASEEMAIDNIVFSSGTLQADWPACAEPSVPIVSQFPATVCPYVPFRLTINGNLGNATEWVIYADENATQEVGRTSSDAFDVFGGAVDGTVYYVRGEGGCITNTVLAGLIIDVDAADCAPDATPGTSFEEGLGSTNDYVDTGDPNQFHDLENNQGQPMVNYAARGKELGVEMVFIPQRMGTGAGIGATDGDAIGITNNADFNFPDGSQGLVLEDTDGVVGAYLSPVDISGLSGVTVSFDYYINPTSYEASGTGTDRVYASIASNRVDREVIIDSRADGSGGLPGLVLGQWTNFSYTITGSYDTPIQLAFAADLDAGTERIIFDNVSFSAGTIVCQDTEAPIVRCPDPISVAGDDASCMAAVDFAATAFDDCTSTVAITYSQESGTMFPVGATPVMVTATDESGKSSTCTFEVTVNDVTPPTLDCPEITVQVDPATNCAFVAADDSLDPLASDNCGAASILSANGLPSLAGDTIFQGTTEIVWTATDLAGLTSTCTQVVNVIVPPGCFATGVTSQDASDFANVTATPNPFRASTTISFQLPFTAEVGVDVLDVSGRVLQSATVQPAGNRTYAWEWKATEAAGGRAPAGVYFVRLRAQGQVFTQRVVLLR